MTRVFENQNVIVAGGSSGIGLASALQFQQHGAHVTITGRNAERLSSAEQKGLKAISLDSANHAALNSFFAESNGIDHLIVSVSGRKGMGDFDVLSLETLREGFEEKFWPVLYTVQAALPFINKGGSITVISAISAIAKIPGTSGLAAVNGALESMVQIWAKEFNEIRVNAVSPGLVDTNWWSFMSEEEKAKAFAQFTPNIKVGRVAQPEEIADAILFVAGNDYMTGKIIGCDGGLS